MTDDDLWTQLRADLATADLATADLDAGRAASIQRAAHAELRDSHRVRRAAGRALESLAITGVVVGQLAWAWSVVLG